jgi:hypothetical protein
MYTILVAAAGIRLKLLLLLLCAFQSLVLSKTEASTLGQLHELL